MAVLLSNGTAQRLLTLLGDPRPDPARTDRQRPAYTRAAEPAVAYDPPWTVRWSAAADSYIVYIPAGAARVWLIQPGASGEACAIVAGVVRVGLTAHATLPDWYSFDGAVGGVWARLSAGSIIVGMTLNNKGALLANISEDTTTGAVTVQQIVRSSICLFLDEDDPDAPAVAPPDPCSNQNIHPGDADYDGGVDDPADETHPGDTNPADEEAHPGDGEADSDDSDHPAALDCYTTT